MVSDAESVSRFSAFVYESQQLNKRLKLIRGKGEDSHYGIFSHLSKASQPVVSRNCVSIGNGYGWETRELTRGDELLNTSRPLTDHTKQA